MQALRYASIMSTNLSANELCQVTNKAVSNQLITIF